MLEVNHETSSAFGYAPDALLATLRNYHDYRTFRLFEGKLSPEMNPRTAPHGATWLCVPAAHDERVAALASPELGS